MSISRNRRGITTSLVIFLSSILGFGALPLFVTGQIPASASVTPSNAVTRFANSNATLYVSTVGRDTNNTTCSQTQPCLTIANAISVANKGDTIDVAAGIYNTVSSGTISITKDLTIQGAGASSTFVGGTSTNSMVSGSVFTVNQGVIATISGMTIQYGSGGGIYNNLGTLTATNDTITNNQARDGGGIYNQGTLTATNDTISDNQAQDGGGGIDNLGTLTATNDTIADNQSSSAGGGIDNLGTLTATNDTISHNSASVGGGIYNFAYITITLTLAATIIADQKSGSNCSGNVTTDAGYNL
ncbi:MAG: hypothetical protein M0019_11355, partial [Actinomycetota bacterium]|nr:hypothetical protein [Actinomycetota bacterium]